jgi:hypothetical protein
MQDSNTCRNFQKKNSKLGRTCAREATDSNYRAPAMGCSGRIWAGAQQRCRSEQKDGDIKKSWLSPGLRFDLTTSRRKSEEPTSGASRKSWQWREPRPFKLVSQDLKADAVDRDKLRHTKSMSWGFLLDSVGRGWRCTAGWWTGGRAFGAELEAADRDRWRRRGSDGGANKLWRRSWRSRPRDKKNTHGEGTKRRWKSWKMSTSSLGGIEHAQRVRRRVGAAGFCQIRIMVREEDVLDDTSPTYL